MHNYNQLKADLGKIMDKLSISAMFMMLMFIKVGHMITGTMSCHMILSLSLIG